jgi:hypothetical protein
MPRTRKPIRFPFKPSIWVQFDDNGFIQAVEAKHECDTDLQDNRVATYELRAVETVEKLLSFKPAR